MTEEQAAKATELARKMQLVAHESDANGLDVVYAALAIAVGTTLAAGADVTALFEMMADVIESVQVKDKSGALIRESDISELVEDTNG